MVIEIPEFGRCCFCMPLRRGIATYGYMNIVWSTLMLLMLIHYNPYLEFAYLYLNLLSYIGWEASIALYSVDIVVSFCLVIGTHLKNVKLLKAYVCYVVLTLLALFTFNLVQSFKIINFFFVISSLTGLFISLCIHVYILILVWSLIRKIETATAEDGYQNQLHQFVNLEDGENIVIEKDSTTIPVET
ncbi:uncharacterized protein LOC119832986 [Zerene cesonia]|uniref:uncharacterized protein LOC119832986 n=1 Tax=Zerene cesonia TaxID=33412 RepID=UPI0018E5A24C|nr:uncharacterized protein LOC119832986 [Zerene cesonia]